MMVHCLFYDYGMHHVVIEVSEKDFFRVVDDLSNEFEIIKKQSPTDIQYCIEDYAGNTFVVGFIFTKNVSDIELPFI